MKLRFIALICMVLAQAAPLKAQGQQVRFSVGDRQFSMPVPDGYCMPEGHLLALANVMAEMDTSNVTLATLFACSKGRAPKPLDPYVLVKTPRFSIDHSLDKAVWLPLWEAAMRDVNAADQAAIEERTEDSYKRLLGSKLDIESKQGVLGRDDECVFVGHTFSTDSGSTSASGRAVACMTVRGQKAMTVTFFDHQPGVLVESMQSAARSLALSIQQVP